MIEQSLKKSYNYNEENPLTKFILLHQHYDSKKDQKETISIYRVNFDITGIMNKNGIELNHSHVKKEFHLGYVLEGKEKLEKITQSYHDNLKEKSDHYDILSLRTEGIETEVIEGVIIDNEVYRIRQLYMKRHAEKIKIKYQKLFLNDECAKTNKFFDHKYHYFLSPNGEIRIFPNKNNTFLL